MSDRERISAVGPSRAPAVRQPPHRPPKAAKEAQTRGHEQPGASPRRETGLDLFRRPFTDCRDSILVQYQEDDAAFDFATGILDRVQRALGI
jgi:hypothetical protein